ncbi:hypothetical protein BH23GEM9_BH23GEM9_21080 [soil metagenome]
MRIVLAGLLVFAAAAAPAASQQMNGGVPTAAAQASRSNATVWGQVRSEQTGAPLRYAVVEVVSRSLAPMNAVTDSSGVYVLRDVPAGRRLLRATHIDHAPHEVELLVVADKQQPLDFDLEFRPLRLSAVTAEGARGLPSALDTMSLAPPDLGPASARVLESTPGVAELGLVDAARDVPGHEPVDPSDVLYVRGSAADLKLVLLNGAPVYAPFHVGGLIHALDADVLRSATLYLGGAPARYDGGLSYVMELETRSGRETGLHGRFGLDLLSGRGRLEGPVGDRATLLTAGRLVHGKGTQSWIEPFPYSYGDGLGRLDVDLGHGHVLTTTGFWNREEVRLDTIGGSRQEGAWGNNAGSARYRGAWGETEVQGTVALTRFRTSLPLGGIRPLVTEGTARRGRLALDFEQAFVGGRFFWGGSLDRVDFEYRAIPQGKHRDSAVVQARAHGDVAGVYGEAGFTLLPRVRMRGGFRADVFSLYDGVRFTPRLSTTVLLTNSATLTLTGGQYRQYVRAPERSLVFLGSIPDSTAGPPLAVAEATHVVLGLAQDLGEGIRLGLEGFYKEFTGLHASPDRKTEASGVDLWVRRNTGTVTGWLGYSLAWVWSVEPDGPRPAQTFSGRHLLSAGAVGPLIGNGIFDLRVSYGAGLPFTAVPEPPAATPSFDVGFGTMAFSRAGGPDSPVLPTEPQDPYIRVDAQISRSWAANWGSFAFEVTPYLKVINALNRRDAIFYQYNRAAGRAEPLAGLPFMPIIGAEWTF